MILDWQRSLYQTAGTLALTWASGFAGAGGAPIFDRYGSIKSSSVAAAASGAGTAAGATGSQVGAGVQSARPTGASISSDDTTSGVQ